MWCPNCKADVAAEVAADHRRVRCANCGGEIPVPASLTGSTKTRDARELLERWAAERTSEPGSRGQTSRASKFASGGDISSDEVRGGHAGGIDLAHEADATGPRNPTAVRERTSHRVDWPQPGVPGPTSIGSTRTSTREGDAGNGSPLAAAVGHESRYHSSHSFHWSAPHFDVQSNLVENEKRKTNWAAVLGHLLAYAGVGLLTVGSTLVLWSYFGGPPNYAPTGWLVSLAGQMMLLLGVVTLVSGGLEQSGEEVRVRIERLGERIIRIEQLAREQTVRGPKGPADLYAASGPITSPRGSSEDPSRQHSGAER